MTAATKLPKFTSADLELMPDDGKRYEIIEGDLYVSRQPSWDHQYICGRIFKFLDDWNASVGLGAVNLAPGLIFADDDDVAPDVIWISKERLAHALDAAGHLHVAPELAVEVLSLGAANERRDREIKLKLYSRRGVGEYWIVDGMRRQIEVYRREQGALGLVATLYAQDTLATPLLPGFACPIDRLFFS
jgi:Uma2 family endonuclease